MRALRYVGYGLFFFLSLVLAMYLTFPWATVKDRVLGEISRRTRIELEAKSLEPHWFTGVHIEELRIHLPSQQAPLEISTLDLRVHLWPLLLGDMGLSFSFPLAGGSVTGQTEITDTKVDIDTHLVDADLALLPILHQATGLVLSGQSTLHAELEIWPKEPKKTQGKLNIKLTELATNPGSSMKGFPIPALNIGSLDWQIPISEGKAVTKDLQLSGENIEAKIDGHIELGNSLPNSRLAMSLGFKPTAAFLAKEPMLGALLGNISRAKGTDGFYTYNLSGYVGRPSFVPKSRVP